MQEKLDGTKPPVSWTRESGLLRYQGHMYIPDQEVLHLQIIRDHHDHPTTRHFREAKTTDLICHSFHWPGLWHMVIGYIKSCTSSARSKTPHHKPYGLLKQLPILNQLWDSISMDFIKQLPMSEGFTAILVVVNRLTKQALFIPTHDTIDSPQLARLFLTHIFAKHSTLGHVTLDCGTEFVSHFSHSLGKLLGMKLHFMSGYHPEGNGQME